jgi:hypothetical protein
MIAGTPQAPTVDRERRANSERSFVRILAICAGALAAIPDLRNFFIARPVGSSYLGIQYNLDDHMVYAAWMRQAMSGHLMFDNRFTTDSQPGLTVHLYFLVLGWIAKVLGIALAMSLARVALSVAFVFLLYRLVRRICPDVYTTKLAMSLSVIGGGIGFLVWNNFGQAINPAITPSMNSLMLGLMPTDVWQPEGYVFPSMLTNGLFMMSLCLIVSAFLSFLSAKESWRWTLQGCLAMFLLMNIHSYDVLIIALTMVGVLATSLIQREFTAKWLGRCLVIAAGALPSTLWFVYVLQRDVVFQARAATPTYAANFRQVIFGYFGLMILGLVALAISHYDSESPRKIRRYGGAATASLLFVVVFVAAGKAVGNTYFLTADAWIGCVVAAIVALVMVSDKNPAWNLVASWALLGTIAPYFPALFQRKLSMGLAVPWAILAALAVGFLTRKLDRGARNLSLVLAICLLGASSIRWIAREFELANLDVSNTTVHPVYLGIDATQILAQLNQFGNQRTVVVAMPGIPFPDPDSPDPKNPIGYREPFLPDLNPILSGMTGVYTYAGHWSETPDYNVRRGEEMRFFLKGETDEERRAFLAKIHADYIVAPVAKAFPALSLEDVSKFGTVIYPPSGQAGHDSGGQFSLVRVGG